MSDQSIGDMQSPFITCAGTKLKLEARGSKQDDNNIEEILYCWTQLWWCWLL